MRVGISRFAIAVAACAFVVFGVVSGAWSQPGTVVAESKVSSTMGGSPGPIDNLDEFGGAVANLGDLDGPGPSVVA